MKTKTILILIIIFLSAKAQGNQILDTYSQKKPEKNFETQGEQEDYQAKKFFAKEYKKQDFKRYCGQITVINESTIKYNEEVLFIWDTKKELIRIFKQGIFYSELITGPVKTGESRKKELENMVLRNDSLKISNLEELKFLSNSPKVKRFRFWLYINGMMNPTVYFFELTNNVATKKTNIETFIKNSKLTFFKSTGWIIM